MKKERKKEAKRKLIQLLLAKAISRLDYLQVTPRVRV